jgi:hypothetical protein
VAESLVDDARIAEVCKAWVEYQENEDPDLVWAREEAFDWFNQDDYATLERFIRGACSRTDTGPDGVAGAIGAGPLETLLRTFTERALPFVEAEAVTNPVLLEALTMVWCGQDEVDLRARIDAILARHGRERQ